MYKFGKRIGGVRDVEWRRCGLLLALALFLPMTGCGGSGGGGGGDTGGGGTGGNYNDDGGGNNAGDDAVDPTLASIQEKIFTPICTQCHTGAGAPQGLRLEDGMSYGMLVNVASAEVSSLMRVEPGNADDSYIIHKLEGTQSVGERMPRGGPYLSTDQIAAIRQWITDGAAETETASASTTSAEKTSLAAAWPVPGSMLDAAPARIMLIADGELDTSGLKGSIEVVRVDDIDPATLQPRAVGNLALRVTSLNPTVISLSAPAEAFAPGQYEVRVKGTGSMPLLDRAARVIDGDDDGMPGGDFVLDFTVGAH